MNALVQHIRVSLRLHFRNKMALLYGYLFPLIFLIAFWVLYRHERIPLLRHMGELLTVSVLGGACFGLPTTLVSERERGVWRRYRLTPVPTWVVVTSTALARYVLVLSAGLLQLGLAFALGMTMPAHPFDLWVAFTLVSFAFIGLGLVIATLADNVPAVQALGQCLFLPMLIIGGVAVPLASLPDWAQHVSAFFPGRYAVESLQLCVTGAGLSATRFSLFALIVIGFAGCIAGAKLFRWDAQQRFAAIGGKAWILPVLASWIAVGVFAESRGRVKVAPATEIAVATTPAGAAPSSSGTKGAAASNATLPTASPPAAITATEAPTPSANTNATSPAPTPATTVTPPVTTAPAPTVALTPPPTVPAKPEPPWMKVTDKDVAALDYNVPPDQGIVSPIADRDEEVADFIKEQITTVQERLSTWEPGMDEDELQAVRNLLCVAAVPDSIQLPSERYVPRVVYEHLKERFPKDKLIKLLTWIAMNPERGMVLDEMNDLGIEGQAGDAYQVRERMYLYAIKFIARLTGRVEE
ncbi:MAG: ABC transporter permease [Opitutaceae bacterium]|nr:ABC transporter permease [Opitutaceae bacterium]